MLVHYQMGKKGVQLGFPHLTWMSLIMEKNITLNPMRIGFFGADAIVSYTYCVTDLIEEFGLFHDCLLALFDFLFRLPYWELIHCFYNNPVVYTPEKPSGHRAIRVPTYSYVY